MDTEPVQQDAAEPGGYLFVGSGGLAPGAPIGCIGIGCTGSINPQFVQRPAFAAFWV